MSGHGSTDNFTVVSTRRIWSQSEKLLIVSEAVAPGASICAVAPGASICAVARRHNLSSSLLYRWIKSFKANEPVPKPAFVPIALAPPAVAVARTNGMIEVVLANGRILRIGADIDMAVLKRIAAALEEQA